MRYQGKISSWKDEQGFGFITPDGGGKPVFVHVKAFANRQRRPAGSEVVTYALAADAKGRLQARHVAFAGERAPLAASPAGGNAAVIAALAFLVLVAVAALAGKLPYAVTGGYLAASAAAFAAYALDKAAARRNRWRTKESTLHLFALAGGWPGALLAQRLLRHKSRKPSFQAVFWATVVLNCGALGWLASPSGAVLLRAMPGWA